MAFDRHSRLGRKSSFVHCQRGLIVMAAWLAMSCGSDEEDEGSGDGGASNAGNNNGDADGSSPDSDEMSFFVTSRGMGKGGDLGGLDGADAHCRALAENVNAVKKQWFAYLSTEDGPVDARDRIGNGPWYNADGVLIAEDVASLHANMGMDNALNVDVSVDETGALVPGRDESKRPPGTLNDHDIITGSTVEGTVVAGSTCMDWTSDASTGTVAQVGHSDKDGPSGRIQWNSAHTSSGCADGRETGGIGSGGGSGRFYCFATD